MEVSLVKPIKTCHYAKGYIEVVDGRNRNELFIHVFLYAQIDAQTVKSIGERYKKALSEYKIEAEYIPEVESICVLVSHENLAMAKNMTVNKIDKASKEIFN